MCYLGDQGIEVCVVLLSYSVWVYGNGTLVKRRWEREREQTRIAELTAKIYRAAGVEVSICYVRITLFCSENSAQSLSFLQREIDDSQCWIHKRTQ